MRSMRYLLRFVIFCEKSDKREVCSLRWVNVAFFGVLSDRKPQGFLENLLWDLTFPGNDA